MKKYVLIVFCLYFSPAVSAQEPVEQPATAPVSAPVSSSEAQSAMQRGDYAIAYHLWKPQADAGNLTAIFNLGWMYHNGYGLRINNLKAKALWETAATQGHANAAFALALMLNRGDRQIKQDITLAVYYFQTAAFKGHKDARIMLLKLFQQNPEKLNNIARNWTETEWKLIARTGKIKSAKANIRSLPSTRGKIITVMKKGQTLLTFNQHNAWLQLYLPLKKTTAWVHKSLVSFASNSKQAQLLNR